MAQSVSGFARRPAGNTRAAERARAAKDLAGEPIPLDLASLVAPYRRHRGVSIRIEQLAHGARLSRGRNNGDRSWSVAPDELDGLEYLPAAESYDAHMLALRVISLEDGDAETLAVIDLPIAGRNGGNEDAGSPAAADAAGAEVQRLRDELVKAKSSLAARDTELATARRQAEDAERSRQSLKSEFTAAEEAWDRELREQLAAAAAEANAALERTRAALESEQSGKVSRSAASTQRALEDARKRWQQEAQAALAKAQTEWKVAEVARMSAAEAGWRVQAEKQLAELRRRAEQAEASLTQAGNSTAKASDAELRRLREQVVSAQAALATRNAELTEARAAAEAARADAESARALSLQSSAGLGKAEQGWKAAEAKRLAAAEARWKEQSSQAIAAANAKVEQAESALGEARARAEARQHQLTVLQTSLAARERELAEARTSAEQGRSQVAADAEQSRERWQQEMAAALAKAQANFKAGETARLAAAEAKWKGELAPALADTRTQLERAEAELAKVNAEFQQQRARADEDMSRLRDNVASEQAAFAAREAELAELRGAAEQARTTADQSLQSVAAEIEKARQKWKKDSDSALAKAEKKWRAEEAPRLAAAEAKWQEQVAARLSEAQDRFDRAEHTAADAQACSEALRHELSAAQASLAHREIELAEARAALEQERDRMRQIPVGAQERKPSWELDADAKRAAFRRRMIRDFSIVACLFALAFMLFPRVQPVVAEVWPQDLSLRADIQPLLQMAGLSKAPPIVAAPAAVTAEPRAMVDVRVANLRESPSTGAAVVSRLARNMEVTPVERRGRWVFVRIGEGADQKQGWVSSAALKDLDATVAARQ